MTSIIIAINFFSLVSSLFFACDRDNKCLIFLSFIFQILCIYFDLVIIFNYWEEVKEGKTVIIIITIIYFVYLFFCTQISYNFFHKDIYEIGVVLADLYNIISDRFFYLCNNRIRINVYVSFSWMSLIKYKRYLVMFWI